MGVSEVGRGIHDGRRPGAAGLDVLPHLGIVAFRFVAERHQPAVAVRFKGNRLLRHRPVTAAGEHLLAGQHQLYRLADRLGRRCCEESVRPLIALAAESAADKRTKHSNLVRSQTKDRGERLLPADDCLRRIPHRQFSRFPIRDGRAHFHRVVRLDRGRISLSLIHI